MSGDSEPEDAWHPHDPLPVLVDNLTRRAEILGARHPPTAGELGERIDALLDLVEVLRRYRPPDDLRRTRLAMFVEDLEWVRGRWATDT